MFGHVRLHYIATIWAFTAGIMWFEHPGAFAVKSNYNFSLILSKAGMDRNTSWDPIGESLEGSGNIVSLHRPRSAGSVRNWSYAHEETSFSRSRFVQVSAVTEELKRISLVLALNAGIQVLLITTAACMGLICLTQVILCCRSGHSRKPVRCECGVGGLDVLHLNAPGHGDEEQQDNP